MTIHRIEGFEQGDLSAFSGTTGTCSISSTTVDTGVYSFRCNPTTTGTGFGWLTGFTSGGEIFTSGTTTTVNPMYVKFDFRYATKPSADSEEILMISDSGATRMASLRLDSAGKLSLYRKDGTTQQVLGSTVLSADTWYRLELYLKKETADVSNNGEYELKIDGTSEFSGTTLDCGAGNVSRVYLGKHTNRNGRSVDLFYDNVIIRDDTWPGAAKVKRMAIDGNGNYTGATSGTYTDADEIPHNSDTDYLTWTSNTNKHSFSLESSSSAGISGTIHCIQTFAISRDTAGGGPTHQIFIREGATDTNIGSGGNPSTTYIFEGGGVKETVPSDSGAWATSDLDGLEVGFYAATSVAQAQRLTSIGVQVAYTPSSGYTLTADAGSYTLSGQTAGLLFGRKVTAGAGSFTLTGQNASLLRAYPMPAAAGSFVLTGQSAGLLWARTLSMGAGSFAFTGQNVGLYHNYPMAAGAGSFSLVGQNAGLIAARTVGVGAGSFVLSGQVAGLFGGFKVTAGVGSYSLSGQDATLIGPAGNYTLSAGAGIFTLSGQAASLLVSRNVGAGAGSFAVSGRDASLLTYRVISAVYGSYVLTGNGVAYDASLGGLVCSFVSVSARVFGDVSIGSFVSGDSLLSPSILGVVSVEEC